MIYSDIIPRLHPQHAAIGDIHQSHLPESPGKDHRRWRRRRTLTCIIEDGVGNSSKVRCHARRIKRNCRKRIVGYGAKRDGCHYAPPVAKAARRASVAVACNCAVMSVFMALQSVVTSDDANAPPVPVPTMFCPPAWLTVE